MICDDYSDAMAGLDNEDHRDVRRGLAQAKAVQESACGGKATELRTPIGVDWRPAKIMRFAGY